MSKARTDDEVLRDVVAEYRRLCKEGFGQLARSRAIEAKVPHDRRHKNNGDYHKWWNALTDKVGGYRKKHEVMFPRSGGSHHISEIIPQALPQGLAV